MSKAWKVELALNFQKSFPIPIYFGFESLAIFRAQEADEHFVYIDHAYFDRGYDRGNFRCLPGIVHQMGLLKVPNDRMRRYCPFPREWRQGSKIYVIPPPPMHVRWYGADDWLQDTLEALREHTDREIVVKPKAGPPLKAFLHEAWAVVSHSSVAGVEAAYHGVPVFGPETSPAHEVGLEDLSRIEFPIFPDREPWLRTLSYSQFSFDEIRSGEAWAVMKELYGAPDLKRPQELDRELVQAG